MEYPIKQANVALGSKTHWLLQIWAYCGLADTNVTPKLNHISVAERMIRQRVY